MSGVNAEKKLRYCKTCGKVFEVSDVVHYSNGKYVDERFCSMECEDSYIQYMIECEAEERYYKEKHGD